jgi:hypothetical protein
MEKAAKAPSRQKKGLASPPLSSFADWRLGGSPRSEMFSRGLRYPSFPIF